MEVGNVYVIWGFVPLWARTLRPGEGGEAGLDDSGREQSRGEGPGDKLRAKGRQRRHAEKDCGGQRGENGARGTRKWTENSIFWESAYWFDAVAARQMCLDNNRWWLKSEEAVGHICRWQSVLSKRGKGGGVGHEKKRTSEGNVEGEMENKRGHWRQIKDTQLNDWMDGPLDLNGHLHTSPSSPLQPWGRKMSAPALGSSASHQPSAVHKQATGTSQYAPLRRERCVDFSPRLLYKHTHTQAIAQRERNERDLRVHWKIARGVPKFLK